MYGNSLHFSVIVLGNESFSKRKERERLLVLNKKGHSDDKKEADGGAVGETVEAALSRTVGSLAANLELLPGAQSILLL